MKKILSLVLISALGGIFTLGTYKLFIEKEQPIVVSNQEATPSFFPTNKSGFLFIAIIIQGSNNEA